MAKRSFSIDLVMQNGEITRLLVYEVKTGKTTLHQKSGLSSNLEITQMSQGGERRNIASHSCLKLETWRLRIK